MPRSARWAAGLASAIALIFTGGGAARAQLFADTFLITGGTLIDGTGAAPRRNPGIYIEGGRITALGNEADQRAGDSLARLDASGKWIIPGLIDGHVHFFQTGGLDARPDIVPHPAGRAYLHVVNEIRDRPEPYLDAYICSGITAVVDPGGPTWGFELRDRRALDPRAPRIAFSGPLLATADPPALELERDEPIWLMKDEAGTRRMVERLSDHRPDMIKIWFVHRRGDDLAAQSALVRGAIQAIHARKLRAAVHATTLETARVAVDAGADTLVHSVGDQDVDDAFGRSDLGEIATGSQADLVLLDADPLADIRNTRRIYAVVRGGVVHRTR